jgi:hypothetical protein
MLSWQVSTPSGQNRAIDFLIIKLYNAVSYSGGITMKRNLLAILAFSFTLFGGSAFADNDNRGGNGPQVQGREQGQAQGQFQNQGQLQGQSQAINSRISNDTRANANAFAAAQAKSSSNSAAMNLTATDVRTGGNVLSTGGNTLTVNEAPIPANTSVSYGGEYTVKGVPNVVVGNVYPTAPCMGSSAVGGSGVGFGFSVGTSWKDDECGIRETARSFAGMGLKEDSLAILCSSQYAAVAPTCLARAPKPEQPVAKAE